MINAPKHSEKKNLKSKFFSSIVLTGTVLLFLLKPGFSKGNETIKAEIKKILKEIPVKEWKVQEADKSEIYTIEQTQTIKEGNDPYDQIATYVESQDIGYFMQLKKHQETKDNNEQIKCKAVIYAILQDANLTSEQKQTLALSQFEILVKMPGCDYRFSKKSSKLTIDDPKYKTKTQRYYAYKNYLT